MRKFLKDFGVLIISAVLIISVFLFWAYLDFVAYKQRFPQASSWTYFFQHK